MTVIIKNEFMKEIDSNFSFLEQMNKF